MLRFDSKNSGTKLPRHMTLIFSVDTQQPDDVQLGGFTGLDEKGIPIIVVANMSVSVDNTGKGSSSAGYNIYEWPTDTRHPIGLGGTRSSLGTSEFLAGRTLRAKNAVAQFRKRFGDETAKDYQAHRMTAAVEAALKWAPETDFKVGGKVDSVILERGGKLRWIQRKSNCYSQDFVP